jgi:putative addiction module component (TIGR02574 family)
MAHRGGDHYNDFSFHLMGAIDMGSSDLGALLQLSVAERIELVQDLWDSVAMESATQVLSPSEVAEISQRLAEHSAQPLDVVPWSEVRRSLGLSA